MEILKKRKLDGTLEMEHKVKLKNVSKWKNVIYVSSLGGVSYEFEKWLKLTENRSWNNFNDKMHNVQSMQTSQVS